MALAPGNTPVYQQATNQSRGVGGTSPVNAQVAPSPIQGGLNPAMAPSILSPTAAGALIAPNGEVTFSEFQARVFNRTEALYKTNGYLSVPLFEDAYLLSKATATYVIQNVSSAGTDPEITQAALSTYRGVLGIPAPTPPPAPVIPVTPIAPLIPNVPTPATTPTTFTPPANSPAVNNANTVVPQPIPVNIPPQPSPGAVNNTPASPGFSITNPYSGFNGLFGGGFNFPTFGGMGGLNLGNMGTNFGFGNSGNLGGGLGNLFNQ